MSFGTRGGLKRHQLPEPQEIIVSPNMIQAVAQTRMADFIHAADRRRLAASAAESRRRPFSRPRSPRQRLRLGVA
jgi:hypothetical protein